MAKARTLGIDRSEGPTASYGSAPLGAAFFGRRFSTPEELFGPLSLAALERDQFRRASAGYAPDAQACTTHDELLITHR